MFEAIRKRLAEIETAHKALPEAAIAIATKLCVDVKSRRRAGQKRRKAARETMKKSGYTGAEIRAAVTMPKRKSSGVSIQVVDSGNQVIVKASSQVHHFAREQAETDEWMDIFSKKIVAAAKGIK